MINLQDVSTSYGSERVLRGVSFRAAPGELIACVGPSGSGKTTLLNVIGGLLSPDGGKAEVAGVRVDEMSHQDRAAFRRQNLAFIFQSLNLLPYLTAIQNVRIPLYLAGVPKAQQQARAAQLLDEMGLNGKSNRLPSQLSIGEQQRVAIARALANEPRVLLADEPTGNLDSLNGEQVMECIRAIADEGVSVVVVTHDQKVADATDRTVTMDDGRIVS